MPDSYQKGDAVVLQNTLKCKIHSVLADGQYIISFGQSTQVVSGTQLSREVETVDYS